MDVKTVGRMVNAGMNAVRVNTAYGDIGEYDRIIGNVWSVADIPVVLDVKGPEVRLKVGERFKAAKGSEVSVGYGKKEPVRFNRNIIGQLRKGDTVLLDKGRVKSTVTGKRDGRVKLKLSGGCEFRDGLGVNVPGRQLKVKTLSKRDLEVIDYAKKKKVDYIALSFTRDVNDVKALKRRLKGSDIGVIAKIENRVGVDNVEDIILACDGIMVARGDLGVEIPFEEIPLIQKDIIVKCNRMGKISIVATEMMHSMVENPQPTRAETSDVANAIIDGSDAVMLSAESAIGKYPVEAVKAMRDIAVEVECHLELTPLNEEVHDKVSMAISKAVTSIIETIDVDRIVVATHSGYTAMLISNFRVCKDIIAITDDPAVKRKLHLVYAVQPVEHRYFKEKDRVREIARYCLTEGLVRKNDMVLFTAGVYTSKPTTNLVQLHRISELLG